MWFGQGKVWKVPVVQKVQCVSVTLEARFLAVRYQLMQDTSVFRRFSKMVTVIYLPRLVKQDSVDYHVCLGLTWCIVQPGLAQSDSLNLSGAHGDLADLHFTQDLPELINVWMRSCVIVGLGCSYGAVAVWSFKKHIISWETSFPTWRTCNCRAKPLSPTIMTQLIQDTSFWLKCQKLKCYDFSGRLVFTEEFHSPSIAW